MIFQRFPQKGRQGCYNPAFLTLKRLYDFKAFSSSVEPSTRIERGVARTLIPYKLTYIVCQVENNTIYSNKIVIRFFQNGYAAKNHILILAGLCRAVSLSSIVPIPLEGAAFFHYCILYRQSRRCF